MCLQRSYMKLMHFTVLRYQVMVQDVLTDIDQAATLESYCQFQIWKHQCTKTKDFFQRCNTIFFVVQDLPGAVSPLHICLLIISSCELCFFISVVHCILEQWCPSTAHWKINHLCILTSLKVPCGVLLWAKKSYTYIQCSCGRISFLPHWTFLRPIFWKLNPALFTCQQFLIFPAFVGTLLQLSISVTVWNFSRDVCYVTEIDEVQTNQDLLVKTSSILLLVVKCSTGYL